MKKSFIVDSTYNDIRLDKWLRNNIGQIPQSLIEKTLRSGKIKVNKKKVKSSFKVKSKDRIDIYNFSFEEKIYQKKKKFIPSKEIIKENEDLIIDNNDDFIVVKKVQVFLFKGEQNQKKI